MLEISINNLKADLVGFAAHVEGMIQNCAIAFNNKDFKLLQQIIEKDEDIANSTEVKFEKGCIETVARFAPKASNLRTILMMLKINNDLERMADNCVNISHNFIDILNSPNININTDEILEISSLVILMVKDSIQSFINEDDELAENVCHRDKVVDKLRHKRVEKIKERIKENISNLDEFLQYWKVFDKFERIADLSTNISEDVVFMIRGKIIRHKI